MAARQVRRWGTEKRVGPKGEYWSLRTGRGPTRLAISLGYVTSAQAERASAQMNQEEAQDRAGRVLEWHAENREEAVSYLLGDPDVADMLDPRPDYPAMPLADYYASVYSEWRAQNTPGGWSQEQRVWKRVLEELGAVRLRDIDPHVVADYLDGLVAQRGPRAGRPVSGNGRRLHRAALQAILKHAYRQRHLQTLPDLAVFQIRGATKRVIEKPAPLDLAELLALMKASPPKFRAMWAVAAGQGLRPSEVNRIRWEDAQLANRTIRIRGTKTDEADATVPLTPLAARELKAWWEACGRPLEGLAFPSKGGLPYGEQGWKKALKEAALKAKIVRRVYPYLLRDSFATIAWLQGIPLEVARRVMRHTADSRILEEVYCRPRPEDVARRLDAFDAPEDP